MRVDFLLLRGVPYAQHRVLYGANGGMADPNDNQEPVDLLNMGELLPLKELAKEYPLSYNTLRTYAQQGVIQARKFGHQWASTRAAIEYYLATRDVERIPKGLRRTS